MNRQSISFHHQMLLIILSFGFVSQSYSLDQTIAEKIEATITQYHKDSTFNGSVLVAKNGEVLLKKGFGQANMEWEIPNTPDTKFRIGSVTKQFTSAIILQLMEEGKLELTDPITKHLSYYPKEPGDRITIHHLLTHTSGIPSYTSRAEIFNLNRNPYRPEKFIELFSSLPLEFEPGTNWKYNNSGYFILGAIIEEVDGKKYDKALTERILKPLGMNDTGYDFHQAVIPKKASGYQKSILGTMRAQYLDSSIPYAAGMMYSTVEDLYKWDRALYEKGPFQNKETLDLWMKPHFPMRKTAAKNQNDNPMESTDNTNELVVPHYGYGWIVADRKIAGKPVRVIEHGGGIFGFTTGFWRLPELDVVVILVDNTSSPKVSELGRKIIGQLVVDPSE